MKKFVSLLLVFCMTLSLSVSAFAQTPCTCGHSPVIYIPGLGDALYDYSGETPVRVYGPDDTQIRAAVPDMVMGVLCLLTRQYRLFAHFGMRAAETMLGRIACDVQGTPVYDTGVQKRPLPTCGAHGDYLSGTGDYTYYYDWRLDPLDSARGLREFVQHVRALTGHEQVSFACHSMGGTVVASYLYLYGSDDVDKIACLSPAYQGISIMGSLLCGEADIRDKDEELALFLCSLLGESERDQTLKVLVRAGYKLKLFRGILRFLQGALDSQFERVFDEYLTPTFAQMPGLWAFVPQSYYERAKTYTFGDDTKYTSLVECIDIYHYNVQLRLTDLFREAMASGVELMIVSGYGISSMPLSYAHTVQSDFLIDTAYMSIGAVCAPYGQTLPQSHVQAVRDGHDHISPDRLVDASTCAFPECTWFIRDQMHFVSPDSCTPMIRWFMAQDGQATVYTDAAYPQFMFQNAEGQLLPLTDGKESIQ